MAKPLTDIIAGVSVITAIVKLFFLLKLKENSVLIKILKSHAISDIFLCFIIIILFDSEFMSKLNIPSAIVFYGNILGCLLTLEIFLIGILKMNGTDIFERNINKIIVGTFVGGLGIAYVDFHVLSSLKQSPYLFIGFGGMMILLLDIIMILKIRTLNLKIDLRNLIVFPTLLAITWGISSLPVFGVADSESYFWVSFIASNMNYSQPILNTLLYFPVILNGYNNFKRKQKEVEELSMQVLDKFDSFIQNDYLEEKDFD
jgi:hypothetical protein